jgi:holo-[acyl-carrier protein] synthase
VKALSQAMAPSPLPRALADLSEIEVLCDDDQRPSLALRGRVLSLAEAAGVTRLHLSMSHDGAVATAIVIAER